MKCDMTKKKYAEVAALLRSWLNDPGDGDERLARKLEPYLERLDSYGRGRFILCRGCPTIECTCLTDLEVYLLDKVLKKDLR